VDLAALVCRYADRFAALGGGEHHVGSPLGAWLVLALAAPAATGDLAEQITDALGTDADTAHRVATARPGPDLTRPDDRAASACRAARPPPTDQLGPSAGFDLQVGTRWLNFRAGIAILGAWRSGGSTARST